MRIETGTVLRILSNDLDAPAQDIADLYKRRWAIELFFRWVKQTLKIRHFVGTSENAVRLQIAVALIAFVLLRLAQATQDTIKSPLTFARLVRTNLMLRRRIDQLLPAPARPKTATANRSSRGDGMKHRPVRHPQPQPKQVKDSHPNSHKQTACRTAVDHDGLGK